MYIQIGIQWAYPAILMTPNPKRLIVRPLKPVPPFIEVSLGEVARFIMTTPSAQGVASHAEFGQED